MIDEKIRGLDIPVRQALRMGEVQRIAQLHHVRANFVPRQNGTGRATLQLMQIRPRHIFHADKRRLSFLVPKLPHAHDVRMLKTLRFLHLTLQVIQSLGIRPSPFIGKHLESHIRLLHLIKGEPHRSHAALAKLQLQDKPPRPHARAFHQATKSQPF